MAGAAAQSAPPPPAPSHCVFQQTGTASSGTCGPLFDENPVFTLAPAAAGTQGVWRSDIHPSAVWAGSLSDDDGKFPAELDVYDAGRGILRTEYGWFAVSHVETSPSLRFELDASREIMPGTLDGKIIERAAALLSSTAVWNRADNRVCPPNATNWSIYCALQKATIEVAGAADHRRPAMEAVRQIVDERSAGRTYNHRLMDYNNDASTTLSDVASLFREATMDMKDPQWLAKHGFATSPAF
ncbi:MAG TPA: hypothetical protein VNU97_15915 [Rhizomicrobium sp.]|nr:hypothetical protein [Rhizomicrobium sp.]